jgi:DNA polymerase subunit Cdc27
MASPSPVIKLVKTHAETIPDDSVVYSIALQDTQNLLTAHEMDRATVLGKTSGNMDLNTCRIAPAMEIARLSIGRFANMDLPEIAPATNTFSAKPRKTTTAANFFGNDAAKKDKTTPAADPKPAAVGTTTKDRPQPAETTKKDSKPAPDTTTKVDKKRPATHKTDTDATAGKKPPGKTQPKPSIFGNAKKAPPPPEAEKENSPATGTADDFVGDADEDEDFLAEETDRRRRNEAQKREDAKKERQRELATAAREQAIEAQAVEKAQPVPSKKRRKRLVEKTSMDASGYLHTETQVIWEDVSDEEDLVVKQAPVKKVATKGGMKQGSLMGFFGKKK